MTDLPTTGPQLLDLRWGQELQERDDGRFQRSLYPRTEQQEADGYLHPGVAAAAAIGAADKTVGAPDPVGGVAITFDAPVPLGMDLTALARSGDGSEVAVELEVLERADLEDQPVRTVARATVRGDGAEEPPNAGAFRAAAIADVPEPVEHELYARCFVCGQANTQGMDLLPGWQAPDTVVTAFQPSDDMLEGGRLPATMVATMLSCPTLWACRDQLDALGAPAALLSTYEVRFLDDAPAGGALRLVGLAGEPDGRSLHGSSALVAEDGRIHAVATASWQAIDDVPAREVGRPDPATATSPMKGGRPDRRSEDEWGQPLPGRRETAGPRSERPGDRDDREAMGVPVERDDPAEPRRSLTDEG